MAISNAQALSQTGATNNQTASEVSAAVTPTSHAYDTTDYGDLRRLGIPTDGISSCTAAVNKAIAIAAVATTPIKFFFPKIGTSYKFLTKPDTINAPIWFAGEGKVATALLRDYNGASASEGLFNFGPTGEGSTVEKMQVMSVSGRSGGSLISIVGDASSAPGWIQLKDLYLSSTGTDTHNYALYVDGSLKTGAPVGVRSLFLDGCSIFGGSLGSVYLKTVVAFNAVNSQAFQAGGTSGKVIITGTVGNPSYYAQWKGSTIHALDLSYLNYGDIDVATILGDVVSTSTASDIRIKGAATGSVQRNCTRGIYEDTGTGILSDKAITARTAGATTSVGHVGTSQTTSCGNALTFTITPITAKLFTIATAGGAAALVFADYKSTTITILADPSNEFEASSTPSAGQTGIFKSANSHVVSIKNGVGSTVVYDLLHLGNVGSVTDPA